MALPEWPRKVWLAGFAVGVCWPSRFAAPVAAFGSFLALAMSSQTGFRHTSGWALILPTNSHGNFDQPDAGIFYPWLPDLPIARIMFLGGIVSFFILLGGGYWFMRNVMERALLLSNGATIEAMHLPLDKLAAGWSTHPEAVASEDERRTRILDALAECGGNQTRAAQRLGVSRQTMVKWLKRYEIARPRKG